MFAASYFFVAKKMRLTSSIVKGMYSIILWICEMVKSPSFM